MLAAGRSFNAWFKEIGWRPGDITRINEGGLPGAEKLALLAQVENVNASWLLTGEGAPYLVHHVPDADSTEEALKALDGGDKWTKGWFHITGQTLLHLWARPMPHPGRPGETFVKVLVIVTNTRDQLLKQLYSLGQDLNKRLDFIEARQLAAGWSGPHDLLQHELLQQINPARDAGDADDYVTPEQLETFRLRNELLHQVADLSDKDLQFVLDIIKRLLK